MKQLLSEPTVRYCEEATSWVIKRPYYAISNLAFFISGAVILIKGKGSRISRIFGAMAIVIGLFSLIYDSTYTYLAQLFDLGGMLIFINVLLYLNLKKLFERIYLIIAQLLLFILSLFLIVDLQGYSGNIVFGLYVTVLVISEIYLIKTKVHKNLRKWLMPLVIFIIGFLIWILDSQKILCSPIGLLNGRAIFHYLNAVTIYQLYKFYELQK